MVKTDHDIIKDELYTLSTEELHRLYVELVGYDYIPIGINEFLDNNDYLGQFYGSGTYPIWRDVLGQIFPTPYSSPWSEIIFEGCVGSGKSSAAIAGSLYDLYKLLCIKNPRELFGILPTKKIMFQIFNATLSLADDAIWSTMNTILVDSPFFKEQLAIAKSNRNNDTLFPKRIDFNVGSRSTHALGHDTFEAILDEMNFQTKVSEQAYKNYNNIVSRQESRFMMKGGTIPGHTWLISSADTENSFLEVHKNRQKNNQYTKSFAFTIWDAKSHLNMYSGEKFNVFIGDEYRDPVILADVHNYPLEKIMEVPIEYYSAFNTDIRLALKDKAGISTGRGAHRLFTSVQRLNDTMVLNNYFNKEEISLDFWDDEDQLIKYFDINRYISSRSYKDNPRYIHVDTGLTGDLLAFASALPAGFIEIERFDDQDLKIKTYREPVVHVEYVVGIRAIPGQEIPLFKVRRFLINELVKRGIPIVLVTTDGFQSSDFRQMVRKAGIKTDYLSLDRTVDPYVNYRNAVYEGRCLNPKVELLRKECVELVITDGKIDHPLEGHKDLSDAVAGAYENVYRSKLTNKGMVKNVADVIDTMLNNTSLYNKIKTGKLI